MSKKTQSKKDQFTQPEKSKLPLILGAVAVLVVAVVVFVFLGGNQNDEAISYFGEPVTQSRSYVGKLISMTPITPEITETQVRIPLDVVDEANIVSFEIENDEGTLVPLMAYITPSGRLFVGSSMCEPCRGRTFSLAGDTLVCDTCRTTYTIEEHVFIAGAQACGSYPPVNMNAKVIDGVIEFDLQEVLSWRIRG